MLENTEGAIKLISQRNWQHRVNKTKKNKTKTKTQHNMCWTPLYANKHKQRKQHMRPPTNNVNKT